ncbi:DnaD domain-containing protein [Pontibacillus litoralis]|uniref:Chromosome replication initiation protein DnaD n=1 Tax=Pontibacillus litoralis JSM 072002 TaxID=1385512 RepID=A0A0A5G9Y9_9BACI|nr:DnaD domain-containing protein [Pontibacillus litoralis]KGX87935.1 chromosome replication initiation protein DnaD [Pontibacillus litoralis JSM 072002]
MSKISLLMKNQMTFPEHLLMRYKQLGLTEIDVMIVLHIHRFQSEGNDFPTPKELLQYATITEQQCSQVLRKLIQKGYLSIEQQTSNHNVINEAYVLDGLWEQLIQSEEDRYVVDKEHSKVEEQPNLFLLFEQEFGRPLSPFEIETINLWLDEDEQQPALIKAALRESVLMGKLNFKYIDRILREWKKKGIRSVQDAREASQSFRNQQATNNKESQPSIPNPSSIYYNWLDDDA